MLKLSLRDFVTPLAYCHQYPIKLKSGQRLPVAPLRTLAMHLQCNTVASAMHLRDTPKLALILTVLCRAGLLHIQHTILTTTPACQAWLTSSPLAQRTHLLAAAKQLQTSDQNLFKLVHAPLNIHWMIQHLQQLTNVSCLTPPSHVQIERDDETGWTLYLPPTLSAQIEFELHHITHWASPRRHICTPQTLANALISGYDIPTICYWLEQAQQAPLATHLRDELYLWHDDLQRVTIQPVHLLTATNPADLALLQTKRRTRRHIIRQITPRHAIVDPRLAKRLPNVSTQSSNGNQLSEQVSIASHQADQWLALNVLNQLKTLCNLPITPSRAALNQLAVGLDPHTLTTLAAHADTILAQLRRAIAGNDSFQPALADLSADADGSHLHTQINAAIQAGHSLEIDYQPLAADYPTTRRIDPLHCEQRGNLSYLSAYCHRAQADRTFRLDRIHAIRQPTTLSIGEEIESTLHCPYCERQTGQVKAGFSTRKLQRYLCNFCQKRYTPKPQADISDPASLSFALSIDEEMRCPYCEAVTRQIRAGISSSGRQRILCKFCQRKYTYHPKNEQSVCNLSNLSL